jgi:cell division protein FtsB
LEFSFDRSRESTPKPSSSEAGPHNSSETLDTPDTSTITNERLRKAIEKNRARQAERNRNQSPPPVQQQFGQVEEQEKINEEPLKENPPPRPRAEERARSSMPKSDSVVTRRSVAKPDEVDFTPIKRAPRKVASQLSYTTSSRKKSKPMDPTLEKYLVRGSWIFCLVMILRLIFANGGVTDFYSQRSLYNDRLSELSRIKKENMQLVMEIERMQTDVAFQKKLVRDNLGFIASDEFLVLFPVEKSVQ